MILTTKNIDELKQIYETELNITLSDEEAYEIGHKMVNLVKNILPSNSTICKK